MNYEVTGIFGGQSSTVEVNAVFGGSSSDLEVRAIAGEVSRAEFAAAQEAANGASDPTQLTALDGQVRIDGQGNAFYWNGSAYAPATTVANLDGGRLPIVRIGEVLYIWQSGNSYAPLSVFSS